VTLAQSDLAAERSGPWDLVIANLTGAHLIATAAHLNALAAPDGRLILGGVQADEESDVAGAFGRAAWAIGARSEEASWVGLLLSQSSF
jgi:ribosomal protein L11 methylase PrmA